MKAILDASVFKRKLRAEGPVAAMYGGDVVSKCRRESDVLYIPGFDRHSLLLGSCAERGFKLCGHPDGVITCKIGMCLKTSGPELPTKASLVVLHATSLDLAGPQGD